jgi:hypothetical protein
MQSGYLCGFRGGRARQGVTFLCLPSRAMSRKTLLRWMARDGKARTAAAADELDRAVEQILRSLREGKPVRLPGVGDLVPGRERAIRFVPKQDGEGCGQ